MRPLPDVEVALPPREQAAVEAVMASLVAPGATLTGTERRLLAGVSRRWADGSDRDPAPDPRERTVQRLTSEAHLFRDRDVSALARAGLPATTFVELIGLVARLQAVDTLCFGLGLDLPNLPEPTNGPVTGNVAPEARLQGGWVPTVGPASPPNALSLLPDEHRAMHQLHGELYLSVADMADLDADRGLHRTQMELVAARTSLLNECFFWMLAHAGMLRASAKRTGRDHDLRALVEPVIDPLLPAGAELLAFTDAAVLRDRHEIGPARQALLDAVGPAGTVRAAAVAGNFQMMNRLLDAIGVRVRPSGMALAAELGQSVPPHLHPD